MNLKPGDKVNSTRRLSVKGNTLVTAKIYTIHRVLKVENDLFVWLDGIDGAYLHERFIELEPCSASGTKSSA